MARIQNHKYTIEEAFRECFYVVPDYQREYVWTEKEVQQLLDDVDEQLASGNSTEYFVGMILVSPTDQRGHYEVIDGQQRLTTFFLQLCALKNLFGSEPQAQLLNGLISTSFIGDGGNVRKSLKLSPRYEYAGELMEKIVALNAEPGAVRAGIKAAGIPAFGSLESLTNAYATVHSYLRATYDDTTKLRGYLDFLARNVVFIQIETDVSSALKIFETINERGIGLNSMDLLKNLLFKNVAPERFSELKDQWKRITGPLDKAKEKPLRFLRYFLMANYVIRNEKDAVVREDEIYAWFINKENAALCDYAGKPFEFVRKIQRNVDHYLNFTEGLGNDGKPNLAMDSLKRLCGGAFSLHHILLLAASEFPKPLFDYFVAQLESFLFYYIFTKSPTRELERNFSLWADELRAVCDVANPLAQQDKLNAFIADRFQKNMAAKEPELSDALRRYTLNSMQQYRTRYLLAKLTQHVDMAYKGLKAPGSLSDYTVLEIEHILPDNPQPDLRASFTASNPQAAYDDYKTRLGNLTLLEKPINIVASNDYFLLKKPEYRKSKYYLTSSIAGLTTVGKDTSINRINGKLMAFDGWTAADIDKRHTMLTSLVADIWKTRPIEAPS